jgi:aspartyl protease family protein
MFRMLLGGVGFIGVIVALWPQGGIIPASGTFSSVSSKPAASAGQVPAPKKKASATVGNGFASVRLERSVDGHFYTDAMVNGATIRFLIDTGATSIALSPEDAQRAGVNFGNGDFTGAAETAGGTVAIKPVLLDRVSVGPLEATQVEAAIVQGALGTSLLGQSWLRRVGTVTINGDVMELR